MDNNKRIRIRYTCVIYVFIMLLLFSLYFLRFFVSNYLQVTLVPIVEKNICD